MRGINVMNTESRVKNFGIFPTCRRGLSFTNIAIC